MTAPSPRFTAPPRLRLWTEHCAGILVDDGARDPASYATVFVARSGSWTPSWCDQDFQAFIEACPVAKKVDLHPLLGTSPLAPRPFDAEQALTMGQEMAEKFRGIIA